MHTTAIRRSAAPIALAATLLAALLVLFSPVSASAHDALVSSSPEADSTVETLPSELTLTFSADLITGEGATEVVVTDATGASVADGPAVTEGAVVTQPLVAEAAAGEYHVIWKVVSSDGHPTSGEYFFSVATATASTPEPTPTATETSSAPFASATPAPSETPASPVEADASPTWIWVLAIVGVLVIAAGVTTAMVLARRRRGGAPSAGSDDSAAR